MTRMLRIVLAFAVAAAAMVVAAPAFAHQQRRSTRVNIIVIAKEFSFTLKLKSAPAGTITFTVTNKGKLPHDFKIAGHKTALIKPRHTSVLKVKLKKGKYTYLCTVAGHSKLGMHGVFTVK